jgi:hypothetical protein
VAGFCEIPGCRHADDAAAEDKHLHFSKLPRDRCAATNVHCAGVGQGSGHALDSGGEGRRLAEFFAIEADRPRKAFYRADEQADIGKKQISYRQVGDSLFGRALQILKEHYGPGADTGRVPWSTTARKAAS